MSRLNAITQFVVVEQTYYRGRTQYGGMGVDQLKELKPDVDRHIKRRFFVATGLH